MTEEEARDLEKRLRGYKLEVSEDSGEWTVQILPSEGEPKLKLFTDYEEALGIITPMTEPLPPY